MSSCKTRALFAYWKPLERVEDFSETGSGAVEQWSGGAFN
jgi:hypothetical protein